MSELLWLRSWTPANVYSADSNPVGLLKIVHSDCKYTEIVPALKNIHDQDVEEMMNPFNVNIFLHNLMKCLYNMSHLLFFHNLLSAEVLTTAW